MSYGTRVRYERNEPVSVEVIEHPAATMTRMEALGVAVETKKRYGFTVAEKDEKTVTGRHPTEPNLQNIPVHTDLSDQAKQAIVQQILNYPIQGS